MYKAISVILIILILFAFSTIFVFDKWQWILFITLVSISVSYLILLYMDTFAKYESNIKEGFETQQESDAVTSKYEWLSNDDLFDDFYASVFTKLTQNEKLIQAESAICMEEFSKDVPKDQLAILDAGCGIGIGTVTFANTPAVTLL